MTTMRTCAGMLGVSLWLAILGVGLSAETSLADGPCLLSASAPGAYALRYWPDRVVLSSSSKTATTVQVGLAQAAQWVVTAEGQPLPAKSWRWRAVEKCVSVDLAAGEQRVQIGWSGQFTRPASGQRVEVILPGQTVARLPCVFALEQMTATGSLRGPAALATPVLQLSAPVKPSQVRLMVGTTVITEWRVGANELRARAPVALGQVTPLELVVSAYNLTTSPVKSLVLNNPLIAREPLRLAQMPAAGRVVEAESFTAEGLGQVAISEKHFQTSGGKSVFNNAGQGHWLEWRFTVPQTGQYDLYVRTACQEPESLRTVALNGQPLPGAGLVRFPTTGGWGYSAQEWSALQLTAPDKPLTLSAGDHTLRLTGVSSDHLNLDYWLLVKR